MLTAAAVAQAPENGKPPENPPGPSAAPSVPPQGTAPDVSVTTFTEAEKLQQIALKPEDLRQAAATWNPGVNAILERRIGPRKVAIGYTDAPASQWIPISASNRHPGAPEVVRTIPGHTPSAVPPKLPSSGTEIAFAPAHHLGHWIATKQITSQKLTTLYLERLRRYDPKLKCVITLTADHAMDQARKADAEIAAGHIRGPLHGVPYGAKDLLDTANIPTTWGAEPFRDRVPTTDAAVIRKLNDAGAVLVAKLSLGALAMNDVWFGGRTNNPWCLEEGASGSSAGPAAAVAAGLVGFAIGSETQGSIISPSMRCGVTGLRPTFGRVPRTGAMALSWTCDKLGPMARTVLDTHLVLQAISGADEGDVATLAAPSNYAMPMPVGPLRVGYFPKWMQEEPATEVDRRALQTLTQAGMKPIEVSLPDWPYASLNLILSAESAAAFEDITLDHRVDQLKMQTADAWPNAFRQARFYSAVDYVQADRLRRRVAQEMAKLMSTVDLLLVPSFRDEMMVIANYTGHPSLTLPAGWIEISQARSDWAPDNPVVARPRFDPPRRVPYGVTLIGRLFGEATLAEAGVALEGEFGMTGKHPPAFA